MKFSTSWLHNTILLLINSSKCLVPNYWPSSGSLLWHASFVSTYVLEINHLWNLCVSVCTKYLNINNSILCLHTVYLFLIHRTINSDFLHTSQQAKNRILLWGQKEFLYIYANFVFEKAKQSVRSYFLLHQTILISSSNRLGMWRMLVHTLVNNVPRVIPMYRSVITDMLRRIFLDTDPDDVFSFAWVFWSCRSILHIFHIRSVTV